MTNIASAIVRQRARSVISRYLHQRGEPKDTCAPVISDGVQSPASATAVTATAVDRPRTSPSSAHSSSTPPQSSGANASSARVRFPPLADDFDVRSLDVFDLLDYQ